MCPCSHPQTMSPLHAVRPSVRPQSLLLLTGDVLPMVSTNTARTLYRLPGTLRKQSLDTHETRDTEDSFRSVPEVDALAIEEVYDLEARGKTFILRRDCVQNDENSVSLGSPLLELKLSEMPAKLAHGNGTGVTTWESSLALALLCAQQPSLLKGRVLEVGCGVGIGGILTSVMPGLSPIPALRSVMLTDGNRQVLKQCQTNLESFRRQCKNLSFSALPAFNVCELDWRDTSTSTTNNEDLFDTIVACDCAYEYNLVKPLARTLKANLKSNGCIHLLAPLHRTCFNDTCCYLRDELNLLVTFEKPLLMQRYRLTERNQPQQVQCSFATKTLAQFSHVTVRHPPV